MRARHRVEQRAVVRDEQHRARERLERRLERLAALDVEVVRRLVEDEEVRAARDDEREREPAPLAARERASPASRAPPSRRRGSGRAASAPPAAAGRSRRPSRRAPSRARRARPRAARSTPARRRGRASPGPPSGSRRPRIVSSSVVFPAPFGPTSATCSPRSSANDDVVQQLLRRRRAGRGPRPRRRRGPSASACRNSNPSVRRGAGRRPRRCSALIRSICFCFDFACFAFVFLAPKRSTNRSSRAISSACALGRLRRVQRPRGLLAPPDVPLAREERRSGRGRARAPRSSPPRGTSGRARRGSRPASIVPQQLLEPLDRLDVEVVRRLVEEQQVGLRRRARGRARRASARRPRRSRAAGRGRRR